MKNGGVSNVTCEEKKEDARSQVNLNKALKKWNKSEKDMVSTLLLPLAIASNFVSSL